MVIIIKIRGLNQYLHQLIFGDMVTLHEILSLEMQRMFLYIQYSCDFDSDFDNILFIHDDL
jgi:hypothetical protein